MHKLIFKSLFILLTFCLSISKISTLSAQDAQIYVGLSDTKDINNSTQIGLSESSKISVLQALDASTFSHLNGCKAIGIRFAFGIDDSNLNMDAQLAYKDKNKVKHAGRKKGVKKGWNEVLFSKPYLFDQNDDIYFGYSYTHSIGNTNPILLSDTDANDGGLYIKLRNTDAVNGITEGYKNLLAQLIIEGDKKRLEKAVLLTHSDLPKTIIAGSKIPIHLFFRNVGLSAIKSLSVTISIGGVQNEQEIELKDEIAPNESRQISVALNEMIAIPKKSKAPLDISFCIKQIDGKPNLLGRVLRYKVTPQKEGDTYERIVLFEQFSTENCSGCPHAESMMQEAFNTFGKNKVVWIIHHIGMGEDFLTLNESKDLKRFFPDNGHTIFAPAQMIDRGGCTTLSLLPSPIGRFPSKSPVLVGALQEAKEKPALASLNIVGGITNKEDDQYAIIIKGKISPYADKSNVRLTAMILESNIPQRQQAGVPHGEDFYHLYAPRVYFTPAEGAKIDFDNEGNFTYYATRTFPIINDDENYTIAAFLHYHNPDNYRGNEVLNAAKIPLTSNVLPTDNITTEKKWCPLIINDRLHFENDADILSLELFSIEGQLIPNRELKPGIYIARITDTTGNIQNIKVIVK